jgi:2-polyprenyl-3-methyl-5-hydroxy-6-metoxy-1,4-benzoquinol methylase
MPAAQPTEAESQAEQERKYYDNPRPEMLGFIPPAARTLLDVGCGRGAFAANLKRALGATVWGIELNPDAARIAATRLDRVIERDITSALPELPDAFFDCIVFNDVLEHLADPYSVVSAVARLLAPRGVVVASLPNVRHYPTAWDLFWNGRWEYRDWGILDRTHLRFFTERSVAALFEERGYRVAVRGINGPTSPFGRFCTRLLPPRFRDIQFMQFAVVAEHKGP